MTATQTKTHAFVTGCSRSGTTALAHLLNRHPDVAIGYERFDYLAGKGEMTPDLFVEDRFRDFRPGDTHHKSYDDPQRGAVLDKIASARVVGDKSPQLVAQLDQLERFPDWKLLVILREPVAVARSYLQRAEVTRNNGGAWPAERGVDAAIFEFNHVMRLVREWADRFPSQCLLLNYEELFLARRNVSGVFEFLGVDPDALGNADDLFSQAQDLAAKGRIDPVQLAVARGIDLANYQTLSSQAGRLAELTADL